MITLVEINQLILNLATLIGAITVLLNVIYKFWSKKISCEKNAEDNRKCKGAKPSYTYLAFMGIVLLLIWLIATKISKLGLINWISEFISLFLKNIKFNILN